MISSLVIGVVFELEVVDEVGELEMVVDEEEVDDELIINEQLIMLVEPAGAVVLVGHAVGGEVPPVQYLFIEHVAHESVVVFVRY